MIVRSIRIYDFFRTGESHQEAHYESDGTDSASCTTIGTQSGCEICPKDTSQCISTCNESEYGDNCDACHPFCHLCTGPLVTDCLSCTNDESLNVISNPQNGNCTCGSRYYNEITTDTCDACDAKCHECYGSPESACLTCANDFGSNVFHLPHS